MMDSTLHYTSVSHAGTLMATINKMRVNSDLCDVTVVVGEYRIMAHRIILSASAPFFYQMLQLHAHPHNKHNNNEVQLNNIDEIAALKIIEFCYTSAISLDDDTVWPLLAASIKFQLPEICTFCCEFLEAGLETSNCILSLRLAAKVHCPQLEDNCVRFLLENIDQACDSRGLTSLSTPDLYSLLSVLALHDVGPATMAKLVGMWMEENMAARQDGVFAQLLQAFPNMAPFLPHPTKNGGPGRDKGLGVHDEDFRRKGTPEHSNRIDGISLSIKKGSGEDTVGEQTKSQSSDFYGLKGSWIGQETVETKDGFGVGASREFICISCGDDFDCEEDLVVHQNECDESARMVGSASGDGLREGLSGKRKGGGEDDLSLSEKGVDGTEIEEGEVCVGGHGKSDVNVRKRKMDEDSNLGNDGESKMGKLTTVAQTESLAGDGNAISSSQVGETGSEIVESCEGGSKTCDTEMNGSLSVKDENVPSQRSDVTTDNVDEHMTVNEDEDDKQDNDGNDDNNNAINRLGRGEGKDGSEDGESMSPPDIVPGNQVDGCLSIPSALSASSGFCSTECHFKTRRESDVPRWQDKNKYSSSSAGLSSSTPIPNSSSSSSLHHLRPQQRCQICGRSFWERKQLSQHWVLDHGVKSKAVMEEINGEEQEPLSSSTAYHQRASRVKQSPSKRSPGREIQSDVGVMQGDSWSLSNFVRAKGSVMDSGWVSNLTKIPVSKMASREDGELSAQNGNENVNHRRQNLDRQLSEQSGSDAIFKSPNVGNVPKDQFSSSSSRSSLAGLVKEENSGNKEMVDNDLKSTSLLAAAGNLSLPAGHPGLTSNEFLTNYLNHYNKLAQWCLAQGPNFCPACLVHHTSDNPCPRSPNSLPPSSMTHQSYSATSAGGCLDKKDKVKEERSEVDGEEEEEKEVNVDGVDEEDMEEGPLDMSKSSLDYSTNNNNSNASSSSSLSTQFVSPSSGLHIQHSRPPSSSSSAVLGSIPPYYGYGHFLSGNSMIDMSTAAMKAAAAVGGLGDLSLIPRQSPIQDLTSSTIQAGSGREHRDQQQHQNYNSYVQQQALSASAIAAQSSVANSGHTNGGLAATTAVFSSLVARAQNGLTGAMGLVSSHDISSASSPSSIFSFPSSPPNPNAASASSSSSSSRIPPPSSSGGKKKSATTVPPKQGFPCTVCNRVYSHQSALFTHMRSHSPSTRTYRCQFCNQTFARAPDLKVHVCPNGIEKPFTCPSCGQTFAKNIHLKRHLATHSGLKPYPCWVCGKRFSRSDHLKRHTQSIHAGARPHACHICGKEFVRKYELNKHMTSHN